MAAPDADRFDFSRVQWQEIDSAVKDGCQRPSRFDRDSLLRVVNYYRGRRQRYRPAAAMAAAYLRTARKLKRAADAVAKVDVGQSWTADSGETIGAALEHQALTAATLARMNDCAEPNPRDFFFDAALGCWIAAGGCLAFSRAPGPTVRYLQAVARPVLGRAPTVDGIRNIIDRIKQRRASVDHARELRSVPDLLAGAIRRLNDLPLDELYTMMTPEQTKLLRADLAALAVQARRIAQSIREVQAPEERDSGPQL